MPSAAATAGLAAAADAWDIAVLLYYLGRHPDGKA